LTHDVKSASDTGQNFCPNRGFHQKRDQQVATSIRVLIVDDFAAWRRFVASAIQKHGELHLVGEASDGLEAIVKAEKLKPDLILLDIGLPG
jgi:PleD family two-component response regulator